ncbi:MAG: phosphatase PAP2 family protein [Oscillospiraceae bacterium]|nr:phosphatase PAP2 family protein [Oscillospiraceae bacterium]
MEILRAIEGIRSPFLDTAVGWITRLGEETIAIAVICVIFWAISKKVAYVIGISFFLSSLTVQGAKIIFRIDRPWVYDPTLSPVPEAIARATGYSFPSGHTQNAAALFGAIGAQIKKKPVAAVFFVIPVLVAFSRMYLGVHTLLDVAVSLLITFAIVFIIVYLLRDGEIGKKALTFSIVLIAFSLAVIALGMILYHTGQIEQAYVADSMKAAGAAIGFAVGLYVESVYIKFPVKSKNIFTQIIKCLMGIMSVLVLQEVLLWNFEPGLMIYLFRYFALIIWITVVYPFAINRFFPAKEES